MDHSRWEMLSDDSKKELKQILNGGYEEVFDYEGVFTFQDDNTLEASKDGKIFASQETEAIEASKVKESAKSLEWLTANQRAKSELRERIQPDVKYSLTDKNTAQVLLKGVLLPIAIKNIEGTSRYTVSDIFGKIHYEVVASGIDKRGVKQEIYKRIVELLNRYNLVEGGEVSLEKLKLLPWERDCSYYKDFNEYYLNQNPGQI